MQTFAQKYSIGMMTLLVIGLIADGLWMSHRHSLSNFIDQNFYIVLALIATVGVMLDIQRRLNKLTKDVRDANQMIYTLANLIKQLEEPNFQRSPVDCYPDFPFEPME